MSEKALTLRVRAFFYFFVQQAADSRIGLSEPFALGNEASQNQQEILSRNREMFFVAGRA